MIKYHPLPDKCCMKCIYGKVVTCGIRCDNEDSLYFQKRLNKRECCPDFRSYRLKPERKKT